MVPQQLAATMKVHIHVRAMKVCMEMAVYASANLVSMVKVSRALIKMSVHRQGIYVIRELLVLIFLDHISALAIEDILKMAQNEKVSKLYKEFSYLTRNITPLIFRVFRKVKYHISQLCLLLSYSLFGEKACVAY